MNVELLPIQYSIITSQYYQSKLTTKENADNKSVTREYHTCATHQQTRAVHCMSDLLTIVTIV